MLCLNGVAAQDRSRSEDLPLGVLDHSYDDDDEDDRHENPDPDRYLHLFLLEDGSNLPYAPHPRGGRHHAYCEQTSPSTRVSKRSARARTRALANSCISPIVGSKYPSIRYTERVAEVGAASSVGSFGDSYYNARRVEKSRSRRGRSRGTESEATPAQGSSMLLDYSGLNNRTRLTVTRSRYGRRQGKLSAEPTALQARVFAMEEAR
jgi:hypothetical protein